MFYMQRRGNFGFCARDDFVLIIKQRLFKAGIERKIFEFF